MNDYDGPAFKGNKKSLEKYKHEPSKTSEVSQFRRPYAPPGLSEDARKQRAHLDHIERKVVAKVSEEEFIKDIPFMRKDILQGHQKQTDFVEDDIPFLKHHERKELMKFEDTISSSEESNLLFNREKFDTMNESIEDEDAEMLSKTELETVTAPYRYETAFKKSKDPKSVMSDVSQRSPQIQRVTEDHSIHQASQLDYRTISKRLVKNKETFLIFDNEEINHDNFR